MDFLIGCSIILIVMVVCWLVLNNYRKIKENLTREINKSINWDINLCPKKDSWEMYKFLEGYGTSFFHCEHCIDVCPNRGCDFRVDTTRPGNGGGNGTLTGAGGESI